MFLLCEIIFISKHLGASQTWWFCFANTCDCFICWIYF